MFNEFTSLVTAYQEEVSKYTVKPTKASSKRLRNLINRMKKVATSAKAELLELDKGE